MSNSLSCILLLGLVIYLGHVHNAPLQAYAKTWCVTNPSLSSNTLENVESYACNHVDCSLLHGENPCFVSSNLFTRASFAMNAYYQQELDLDCVFGGSGLKAITDPSYGNCNLFVASEEMISAPAALSKWCIAKPTAPFSLLQMNIDFACSQVDCSVIQFGGECQLLDTIMNHASVVMNLFYQASDRTDSSCYFNSTGMIVIQDPSYGTCIYERKGEKGGVKVPALSVKIKHGRSSVILRSVAITVATAMFSGLVLWCVRVVCLRFRRPSQAIESEMQQMPTPAPSQPPPQASCSFTVSIPCEAGVCSLPCSF